MKTITKRVKITDAEIKKALTNEFVARLRDTRFAVELRFHKSREKGSWYLINKRKTRVGNGWELLGYWPQMRANDFFKVLPKKIAIDIAIEGGARSSLDELLIVNDVLDFYLAHIEAQKHLSDSRKADIKSIIKNHIAPRLGRVSAEGINKATIKDSFIVPMQELYALSTIRKAFGMLKTAYNQAYTEERINRNPVSGIRINDFTKAKVEPKEAQLKEYEFEQLVNHDIHQLKIHEKVLVALQISYGTRISETRLIKWRDISLKKKVLTIPKKNTKTGVELVLPLSDIMLNVLEWYRYNTPKREYLFTPRTGDKPISLMTATKIYKKVSMGVWTSHDCRKFARSTLAELGVDKYTAERLLNHALSTLDETYIYTALEKQKREAIDKYHAYLKEAGLYNVVGL